MCEPLIRLAARHGLPFPMLAELSQGMIQAIAPGLVLAVPVLVVWLGVKIYSFFNSHRD